MLCWRKTAMPWLLPLRRHTQCVPNLLCWLQRPHPLVPTEDFYFWFLFPPGVVKSARTYVVLWKWWKIILVWLILDKTIITTVLKASKCTFESRSTQRKNNLEPTLIQKMSLLYSTNCPWPRSAKNQRLSSPWKYRFPLEYLCPDMVFFLPCCGYIWCCRFLQCHLLEVILNLQCSKRSTREHYPTWFK